MSALGHEPTSKIDLWMSGLRHLADIPRLAIKACSLVEAGIEDGFALRRPSQAESLKLGN
jgi:hypothetical protein